MSSYNKIAGILGVEEQFLLELDRVMSERTGRSGVFEKISDDLEEHIKKTLKAVGAENSNTEEIKAKLREAVKNQENELLKFLETVPGETEFDKAANLARQIAKIGKGFFLKKSYAQDILRKRPPQNLLDFLKYKDVDELFKNHDVTEAFSALRFMESNEWMHETFEVAYSNFTANDFEEREIQIKVLGPEWHEVAKKFVEKKHHNVSHLKEFGVIFLNPIKEDISGKFIRDFALLLHYFHEVEFYSKLFRKYSKENDFAGRFKALLRGDVKEVSVVGDGEWLIVQRYLFKENPNDPRLFLPRVNPESMHWFRGERDISDFGASRSDTGLKIWKDLDWVASVADNGEIISFDLEDNAMSQVSFEKSIEGSFFYHQREALWTKIFCEFAGGESQMEELLIDNFGKGIISF